MNREDDAADQGQRVAGSPRRDRDGGNPVDEPGAHGERPDPPLAPVDGADGGPVETPVETDDAEALEAGRWLFAQPCRFVISGAGIDQIPETDMPEVAFAGRSNVGKSSLLNALVGHKMLAKTSNTPGRTQLLNFFDLAGRLMLADLPGYGFARAPKVNVERWTRLVLLYLRGRAPLRRALLLIDARHGIKDIDREVMTMLDKAAVSYQAVLTKCDKVKPSPLAHLIDDTARELTRHTAAHPQVHATSAQTGEGLPQLRAALAKLSVSRET